MGYGSAWRLAQIANPIREANVSKPYRVKANCGLVKIESLGGIDATDKIEIAEDLEAFLNATLCVGVSLDGSGGLELDQRQAAIEFAYGPGIVKRLKAVVRAVNSLSVAMEQHVDDTNAQDVAEPQRKPAKARKK